MYDDTYLNKNDSLNDLIYIYSIFFAEAQEQGPTNVLSGGNVDEIPINLATDAKSVVLNYGNEFNITYEDHSTISICKIERQSSEVLLRSSLSNDRRQNILT